MAYICNTDALGQFSVAGNGLQCGTNMAVRQHLRRGFRNSKGFYDVTNLMA